MFGPHFDGRYGTRPGMTGLMNCLFRACVYLLCVLLLSSFCRCSCVWPPEYDDLQLRCACSSGGSQRLSVHCSSVDFTRLVEALKSLPPMDLLAIANSTWDTLQDGFFTGLDVRSIQLSSVGLRTISLSAFQGLERTLTSLSLEQNELRAIPSQQLRRLSVLKELDISRNRITEVLDGAFNGLPLSTLKLSDNMLQIAPAGFHGLESTLHSLNLKGTGQTSIPKAVKQLTELSFLDMSQNKISELPPSDLLPLRQLTALTFERNMINFVHAEAFKGLNATLSSLSLLNNKIEIFPTEAIRTLTQLRVLDLGFNRMKTVPVDGFTGNPLLTLLALDGNPLSTLSESSFHHLNSTLRGLSIGGSTLVCDCRIRWIVEWIKTYDLQVTSRERNPQFCGRPQNLRRRLLPQMSVDELKCDDQVSTAYSSTTKADEGSTDMFSVPRVTSSSTGVKDSRAPRTALGRIRLIDVNRQGSEVRMRWDASMDDLRARNSPQVYAMYRVFGEQRFLPGTSASMTTGWAQMSIPEDKPLVVCVVEAAQAATLSRESVPFSQCQEVTAERVSDSQLNKIIIGSSAAVCGMIVVAVVIFICCSKRPNRKEAVPRPTVKSEHEWETSSLYSGRSIPRARAYHGSVNHSFLHEPRMPDDVQSCRSLPATRIARNPMLSNRDLHNSHIALSQLSGPHSFLGSSYNEQPNSGWNNHWENGDVYSDRHLPSRLSYAKENSFG